MKRWYVELAVFVAAASGAVLLAYLLAQSVGLHPLVTPPAELRQKDWMVAVGAVLFVVVVDLLVLGAIALKHRREAQAKVEDRGPALMR